MIAFLDPAYPLQGQSAALNSDQDDMMSWIKSQNNINAAGAVKGHLLNDNLGGTAMNANLFPLTKAANAVHLKTAENDVKNKVWNDQTPTYYYVDAEIGGGTIDKLTGEIGDWNMHTNKVSNLRSFTVVSHLKKPNDMETANPDDNDYVKAEQRNAAAFSHGLALKPHSRVSELNDDWAGLRDISGSTTKFTYES
ncbi:hypothetical protein CHU95_05280 [Niveispirillum lacus]|uniref:Uncharacterized protein n=2 Tax=Niveispirillum lacus TaxID=1981099 RepID=A0A255Z3V9_9PROT|nr:hypothetical protein CHU95_05280 [Niveispirillum lacus]